MAADHGGMLSTSPSLAVCSARPRALALAACVSALPPIAADGSPDDLIELQVMPAGVFVPADGRAMDVPAWRIDAAIAARVIAKFGSSKTPRVVDYEHQTLRKEENGQPAPAAAWMRELVWREGQGLFARTELTPRARTAIANREYLYFSPVFEYDRRTGDVLDIRLGALTNTPAIDGMAALAVAAAAFHLSSQESSMDLLKALIAALGLPETATQDEALADLSKKMKTFSEMREKVGVKPDDDDDKVLAACSALVARQVDPAQYVPIAALEAVKGQIAALSAQQLERQIEDAIATGKAAGKILPQQEGWARDLGKSNFAALTAYLDKTPGIAALTHTQTQGQAPAGAGAGSLTADELAVCSATGIAPEAFLKARA
ncbi:MAG: phage protease [Burkholderiaceae bacterium]